MDKLKKNKEIVILLLIIFYLYSNFVLVGCNLFNEKRMNDTLKVGLISEYFNDLSFGQMSKKGIEEAKEKYGVEPEYKEIKGNNDGIDKIFKDFAEHNNITIATGEELKTNIQKISRERRDKNFVILDEEVNEPNVKSILFKHEQGAFLMGIIAGNETKTNKVGFIGGMDNKIGNEFYAGFTAGVKTVNEKALEGLMSRKMIRFNESFLDEKKAYEKAIDLYDSGCDIIFQAAGNAGIGVFKAAKEKGKKAIGVDTDQKVTAKEYKDVIISSMIKRTDEAMLNLCKEAREGSFKSGIRNKEELGLADNMLDYAPTTKESVSKKTMEDLEKYKKLVIEEVIEVPSRLFEVVGFKTIT
ncbi:BMP family ABC transporter substrate-binding protein [Clostridium baratii]|uniref:BMP family lipoprotein n=1 Tax=Clostridium baratii TaxID=1561 RepID=UPI002913CB3D|nr:BMP family ABC transporter substrate-binding protein [Clostridium baratii]MDU4911575.1 BMP family ABC transporter substrate-binding protein [Clostridium baratii]